MSDENASLETISPEDVPENANVLQCGDVLNSDGDIIGRIDRTEMEVGD